MPAQSLNLFQVGKMRAVATLAQQILRLVDTRYTGYGRGYVYVSGQASLFPLLFLKLDSRLCFDTLFPEGMLNGTDIADQIR
jgi:hypothetical protein